MEDSTEFIAVVRGASNVEVQVIFRALADKWRPDLRLAGRVAEDHGLPDRHCHAGYLRNLATGARFSIFHDRGPGVPMCHLDGIRAVAAADGVQGDIEAGCDLVLLNKFGKLEIAGDGLASAFRAAISAGLPLLTSVSPAHDGAWIGSSLFFPPTRPRSTCGARRLRGTRDAAVASSYLAGIRLVGDE